MCGDLVGFGAAEVAKTCATVRFRIAVEDFLPITSVWYAHTIVMPRHRGEIKNDDDDLVPTPGLPHEADHALLRVATVDPFKSIAIAVEFMQRAFGTVSAVQIHHPFLKAAVRFVLQQMPFETLIV